MRTSLSSVKGRSLHQRREYRSPKSKTLLIFLMSTSPLAFAQTCIPLSGSTQCPAFNSSSISTGPQLVAQYPFLTFVSNTQQFDERLSQYISSDYAQIKYQQILGCSNVNLTNTTDLYARYTTSVVCNSIVQNSIQPCSLSATDSRPLCADSCAQQATSEEEIAVNSQLCGTPQQNFLDQIRADFINCALPANSLSGSCITGEENEPNNCGFSGNLQGLCGYCGTSSPNATDSCCAGSSVTSRCSGVTLPTSSTMPPLFPSSTTSANPSATNGTAVASSALSGSHHGLSGGQIAGIVIGSIIGAVLLIGLLVLCCICLRRRRRGSQKGSIFNMPSPQRRAEPGMVFAPRDATRGSQPAYEALNGGRVARMSALEGTSSASQSRGNPTASGFASDNRHRYGDTSDSDMYGNSPESRRGGVPPVTGKRNGSLSSNSMLGGSEDPYSLNSGSGGQFSSPEGVASGQSEQLPFFKDYYSQDEIHPNDKVATLWAYQPRAADEFELDRGDMLKVVGIWDDGWATGIRIDERAEDYDGKHRVQRDSGVSNGPGQRGDSPSVNGEIKAFPLVCVCLPEHWKKTIDGDPNEGGSGGQPSGPEV